MKNVLSHHPRRLGACFAIALTTVLVAALPVAFDARHNVWIAASVGLRVPGPRGAAVIASRSTNGGLAWAPPVTIAAATGSNQDFEKPWIVCDDTATSPFYGSCYAAFDDHGNGNAFKAAYSRDGGLTWTLSSTPNVGVIGVQ